MTVVVEPGQLPGVIDNLISLASRSARHARGRISRMVRRVGEAVVRGRIVGIDTAFPQSPVEFMGFTVSVVSLAIARVVDGKLVSRSVDTKVLVEAFGDIDLDYVVGYARLLEREKALEEVRKGNVAMLVLDGEIMPYRAASSRDGAWDDVYKETKRLIEEAVDLGVDIVGVVKRSFSKTLAKLVDMDINDRVIATFLLQRGEYIVLDHPLLGGPCKLAYYKPMRGPDQSVKIEVCGNVDNVVAVLVRETGPTGLPWIIDVVDSLAKNSVSTTLSYLEALISSRTARRNYPQLGLPANLQEKRRGETAGF